jgi:hypothetical protein
VKYVRMNGRDIYFPVRKSVGETDNINVSLVCVNGRR